MKEMREERVRPASSLPRYSEPYVERVLVMPSTYTENIILDD